MSGYYSSENEAIWPRFECEEKSPADSLMSMAIEITFGEEGKRRR
jgi:hypothetical protein